MHSTVLWFLNLAISTYNVRLVEKDGSFILVGMKSEDPNSALVWLEKLKEASKRRKK